MKTGKKALFIPVLLIIVLGVAVYANSLNGKFIWDDEHLVRDNIYTKKPAHLASIFTTHIGAGADARHFYYRPLQMLTYMADYSLWRLNVTGYHITNILLHILAALAVFWLVNILYDDRILSLVAGMLFVSHPAHTGAVAYISGRSDPLALIFMLLCFIAYIKTSEKRTPVTYCLMLASYALALLSRETSLILPALVALYHYVFKKRFKALDFLPMAGIALVYMFLRATVFSRFLMHSSYSHTFFQRIPGSFAAITDYLRLLVLPFPLHMEYGNKLFSFTDPRVLAGIVIMAAALTYAFRKRHKKSPVFFAVCWFFIALLPVSNIYPVGAYMAEHWLYLPSIGFFILAGAALARLYRTGAYKPLAISAGVILTLYFSCLTVIQNNYWKDPLLFYEKTLRYAPTSARIHNNLGNIYSSIGKGDEAVLSYKKALEFNPRYARAYNNLGDVYREQGNTKEALVLFKKAVEIDPGNARAYNNIGNIYSLSGETKDALAAYEKALEINPHFSSAYNNLGNLRASLGQIEEAVTAYEKAIEINPDNVKALDNLGNIYASGGETEKAIALYKRATKAAPDFPGTYIDLGITYMNMGKGNEKEAVAAFEKALAIDPDNAEAHYNLGVIYMMIGFKEDAITSFKKALGSKPGYSEAYYNLGLIYANTGRKPEAIEAYKKALEIDPDFAEAYNRIGIIYNETGKKKEALAAFQKAIKARPDHAMAYNNLGVVYITTGRQKEAIVAFRKATEVNPKYAEAYGSLGLIYAITGDYTTAITYYSKTIELLPADFRAYYSLGVAYDKVGDKAKAMEQVSALRELGKNEHADKLEGIIKQK